MGVYKIDSWDVLESESLDSVSIIMLVSIDGVLDRINDFLVSEVVFIGTMMKYTTENVTPHMKPHSTCCTVW